MALPAVVHKLRLHLSDADRGVYEELETVAARHPSESEPFFVVRLFAWALCWEPGIVFSKGVSDVDEPALSVRAPDGTLTAWIEVGLPAPDRLHRAAKRTSRVLVFPHRDTRAWRATCASERIHRAEHIEVVELDPAFVSSVAANMERNLKWSVTVTDGTLYLESDGRTSSSAIERTMLGAE